MVSEALHTTAQEFLSLLLQAVLYGVALRGAVLAIRAFRGLEQWLRSKLSDEDEAYLDNAIKFAIKAAEQSGLSGQIKNEGAAKKTFAIQTLQGMLRARGLHVLAENVDELAARIEAGIFDGVHIPYAIVEADEGVFANVQLAPDGKIEYICEHCPDIDFCVRKGFCAATAATRPVPNKDALPIKLEEKLEE